MKTFLPCAVLSLSTLACSAGPVQVGVPAAPRGGAAPVPAAGAACRIPDLQASLLARVNAARARGATCGSAGRFGPAAPLAWNDLLEQAAERHSRDMAAGNFFSHTGADGHELRERADAAGYRWRTLAENIAGGRDTVNGVVDQWLASPGHCANLMKPDLVHVGVACVAGGPRNTYVTYWTMALGAPPR